MPVCGKRVRLITLVPPCFRPYITRVCITRSAATIQTIDLNNLDTVNRFHRLNGFFYYRR